MTSQKRVVGRGLEHLPGELGSESRQGLERRQFGKAIVRAEPPRERCHRQRTRILTGEPSSTQRLGGSTSHVCVPIFERLDQCQHATQVGH
ncbi:MAG: hypothetical protein WCI05_12210, partial [Myxococcales bacterium]